MKLLTAATILLIISQLSSCAHLKLPKRDKVIKSVLSNLIVKHKLKGLLVFNSIEKERSPDILAKSRELIREANLLTTVALIRFGRTFNLRKFKRNVTRYSRDSSFLIAQPQVTASESVYILVLADSHKLLHRNKLLVAQMQQLQSRFSSIQGVSKTLLVTFVRKPYRRYKQLLQRIPTGPFYWYNVDVLEIAMRRKRSVARFDYKVIQLDSFRKTLRVRRYSRDVGFFTDPMNDLHGLKLYGHSICGKEDFKGRILLDT